MKKIIKNNYKIIIGILIGITISLTSVYAVDAYIESKKVSYENKYTDKNNTQEAIDELYERSGIHQEKWTDSILNGADPVLKDPLIPVEIKPNGDVYYANLNSEWYNYSEKRWANAVILVDNPSNTNYKVGDHILESDIESYFVWIPRYQYKIWDTGNYEGLLTLNQLSDNNEQTKNNTAFWKVAGSNAKLININFGDVSRAPKMTEPTSTEVYYTHPAFTLGDKDLNGIWVGKFETSKSTNDIIIKPNVKSWRNQTVKDFFNVSKEYNTSLYSHMMKRMEWGAVAYLSHSQYGIGTEVNINNNSEYKTGYSAIAGTNQSSMPGESAESSDETKTQSWNTPIGYLASTTGNITGIYDMSGGSLEYMASCLKNKVGNSDFDDISLNKEIENGYIDAYPEDSTDITYNKRKLGDATGEVGPFYSYLEMDGSIYYHSSWYSDIASFIQTSAPWFLSGGLYMDGILAGQFTFGWQDGSAMTSASFRLVLSPSNN